MSLEEVKKKFAHPGNEGTIIACILKDPSGYFDVESRLSDSDFLTPHHRALWTVIQSLMRSGITAIDVASIMNQAASMGIDKDLVDYRYIAALTDKLVDPSNIDFYIGRVADASTKFKIVQTLEDLQECADQNRTLTGETLGAHDILALAQDKFLKIAVESNRGDEAVNLAAGFSELIEQLNLDPNANAGLPTGFPILDSAINGLEPGTLTVLGARPKVGKSTWLLNVAKHLAYTSGLPGLYLDTEMSSREQRFRLLSVLSGVPEREIKTGIFRNNPQNAMAIEEAVRISESGLILHKYYPDFTAEGISSLARKYHHQMGIGWVIFDYIKLPDADLQLIGNVKEHQALGFLCVALKNLAGQLKIPIVAAAQIGRGGANKGAVSAADFADSDRILRYANTLLGLSCKTRDELLKAEEAYGRDTALKLGTHRLQVLETRGGGSNFDGIDVYFRKSIITMKEAPVQFRSLQPPDPTGEGD